MLTAHSHDFVGTPNYVLRNPEVPRDTGILSELRAARPRNCSSIPGRGKTLFCLVVIVLTGVTAYLSD